MYVLELRLMFLDLRNLVLQYCTPIGASAMANPGHFSRLRPRLNTLWLRFSRYFLQIKYVNKYNSGTYIIIVGHCRSFFA